MTAASGDVPNDRICSMLSMPTELLLVIVERINTDHDLLALACTCRRLHHIALNRHFSKHRFDPSCKEVDLFFPDDVSIHLLRGLALSFNLTGSSIDRLSYDYGYTQDSMAPLKQVRLLTHYISKLSSVKSVSLRLATHLRGPPERWSNMNIKLLDTVLSKSCTCIQITTSPLSTRDEGPKNMPLSSKPIDWLKSYWPSNSQPSYYRNTLTTCSITTFPRFLRPFYYHMLDTNSSSITKLSFTTMSGGGTDWATMLVSLFFPRLESLSITKCVIPRDRFAKFLQRHPGTLTAFEYHNIRYDPRPKAPFRTRLLDLVFKSSLKTLTISPKHMAHFMPPSSVLCCLRSVVIVLEDGENDTLETALRALIPCTSRITLTLSISCPGFGLEVWFSHIGRIFQSKPRSRARLESELHCVETLVMDSGESGFSDSLALHYMARWLSLFPDLRMVVLKGKRKSYKYVGEEEEDTAAFIHALKEACPHIHFECSI